MQYTRHGFSAVITRLLKFSLYNPRKLDLRIQNFSICKRTCGDHCKGLLNANKPLEFHQMLAWYEMDPECAIKNGSKLNTNGNSKSFKLLHLLFYLIIYVSLECTFHSLNFHLCSFSSTYLKCISSGFCTILVGNRYYETVIKSIM